MQKETEIKEWVIYIDSLSNNKGNGTELILIGLNGQRIEYALYLQFLATNNATEYKALILNLELVREVGA